MAEPVILEVARTPFAKRNGAFRETRPDVLLAHALRGLAKRAGIDPSKIEDVVTGVVQQVGEQGANVGRLGVLLAGFPVSVPAPWTWAKTPAGKPSAFTARAMAPATISDVSACAGCALTITGQPAARAEAVSPPAVE